MLESIPIQTLCQTLQNGLVEWVSDHLLERSANNELVRYPPDQKPTASLLEGMVLQAMSLIITNPMLPKKVACQAEVKPHFP